MVKYLNKSIQRASELVGSCFFDCGTGLRYFVSSLLAFSLYFHVKEVKVVLQMLLKVFNIRSSNTFRMVL